ncbi:ATP-dependent carboxylate-amine ligase [Sphingobacteriaceae bacterium]|nr:ATP-dependent carboxylate-amine ligase [Sphingobacteriaceae bacterium]
MADKLNIAVTGSGSLIGQAVIKSVQRSELNDKINFIGLDYFENTVGSFWCSKNILLPDILNPTVSHTAWLTVILDTLKANNVKLLFVGVDFELPLFAKYKSQIEESTGAIVLVCPEDVISIADDKYLTYEFLKQNDLAYPQSWLPEEVDPSSLNYPLIVKPRKGARSVGVSKVNDPKELPKALAMAKEPVIQELVGNDETEYTCGVIFLNGELKRSIVLRRHLKAGNTYLSYYKKDFPSIISEYLELVATKLKPFGACNFQLRLDEKGVPKIFEINARHSGTTYIRSLFGFKEVEYIINLLLFNKEMEFDLKEGTVVRYYDEFFIPENK